MILLDQGKAEAGDTAKEYLLAGPDHWDGEG